MGKRMISVLKNTALIIGFCLLIGMIFQVGFNNKSIVPGLVAYVSCGLFVVITSRYSAKQINDMNQNIKEKAFDLINSPIFVLDVEDNVIDINPAAQKIINISKAKLLGLPLQKLLTNLSEDLLDFKFEKTQTFELMANGRWYVCSCLKIRNQGESFDTKILVLDEVTEQKLTDKTIKLLESESRKLNEEKSIFMESISMFSDMNKPELIFNALAEKIIALLDITSIFIFYPDHANPQYNKLVADAYRDDVGVHEKGSNTSFLRLHQGVFQEIFDEVKDYKIQYSSVINLKASAENFSLSSALRMISFSSSSKPLMAFTSNGEGINSRTASSMR